MSISKVNYNMARYIKRTVDELLEPLDTVLWDVWGKRGKTVDAFEFIKNDLTWRAIKIGYEEGFSDNAVVFIHDLRESLGSKTNISTHNQRETLLKHVENNKENVTHLKVPKPIEYLDAFDHFHGTDYSDTIRTLYFRIVEAILKADGRFTQRKQTTLDNFNELINTPFSYEEYDKLDEETSSDEETKQEKQKSLEELFKELHSLVGLDAVKRDVVELVNFIKVQQIRQTRGMSGVPISRHLVFFGNPGTGKTTIARLLAQIYKSLNIVTKGHLIETDRAGLVAGYVGQTALKVKDIVTQALGGILFIDEAYSLTGSEQDYGREAIDTLIKLMEDNRNNLIVVVAGYTEKMNEFLLSNPGLKSRFNKYFYFEDYTPSQLVEIFKLFCLNAGFGLSVEAREKVTAIFQVLYDMRDETFGNARLARNVFERAVNNQANRIITKTNITEEMLSAIQAEDIPGEIELNTLDTPKLVNSQQNNEAELRAKVIEAVKLDPKNVTAWLDLADLVEEPEQVIDCLQRVLYIDPNNNIAREKMNLYKSKGLK